MHELSIAQSILEMACRHAVGRRVTKVALKAGHLRQIVPAALTFSFELVAQGTAAEGADLEIEAVPVVGRCRRCGVESELAEFPLQCQSCGRFDLEIIAGEELFVEWLELEEADDGDGSGEDAGGGGRAGCERRAGAGEPGEV